jgi:hypothetical protein
VLWWRVPACLCGRAFSPLSGRAKPVGRGPCGPALWPHRLARRGPVRGGGGGGGGEGQPASAIRWNTSRLNALMVSRSPCGVRTVSPVRRMRPFSEGWPFDALCIA